LEIPFAATAVDLMSGELVVFREGSLLQAIRASTALPGLFAPVEHKGRVLVDGAVLSTVPVRVARAMGADVVVAVDVRHEAPACVTTRRGAMERARWAVVEHLVSEELSGADLVIRPYIGDVHSLDFRKTLHCIAAGQRAATQVLPGLVQLLSDSRSAVGSWESG